MEEIEKEGGRRRLMGERWINSRTNQLTIQSHTRTATGTQWADLQTKWRSVCVCARAHLMCIFDAACCAVSSCVSMHMHAPGCS